ncbi:MAG: PD40 domain-containing protein [Holophagales bacterium]|nr:PD40 domain-containing protein [Holophagales bacterium]
MCPPRITARGVPYASALRHRRRRRRALPLPVSGRRPRRRRGSAGSGALRDAHRVRLRGRDLDRPARGGEATPRERAASQPQAGFSPDGATVAFTGTYDENADVHVVPAGGGEPRRLTHHPGRTRRFGFTPDGKRVLFLSMRRTPRDPSEALHGADRRRTGRELPLLRRGRLLFARRQPPCLRPFPAVAGGVEEVPGRADDARLDRGPVGLRVAKVPRENSNDRRPMWVGDTLFLSDRSGPGDALRV